MAERNIKPETVLAELASRHVIDHKVKQETAASSVLSAADAQG